MRASSLGVAIPALLLTCLATASAAEPADPGFTAVPIAQSVSLLQGYECNIPVSAGDDGIVLVDACGARMADKLLAAAQRLTAKPLRFVINTHAHSDHVNGDVVLQKLAPVIAHHTVRTRMAAGNEVTGDKPKPPEALPIITFDNEMILHLNGEEIRLLHLPPGHTDGDVVVFFVKANVVCMGDVFISPAASFGDRWFGGGMLGLINSLEFVLPQIPSDAKIIPGHGKISTRADVVRGLEVLKGMKELVESAVRSGKSLQQLQAERPFDKWRGLVPEWSSSDKSLDGWVKDFYREIAPSN
jgi:glyoxylase-like metal-dependent hydrolase (beta-lactamase superfamily II)